MLTGAFRPYIRDALSQGKHLASTADEALAAMGEGQVTPNWPYGLREAIHIDTQRKSISVSKLFEEHVTKLDNWSFCSALLKVFPEAASHVKFLDKDNISLSNFAEHPTWDDAWQEAGSPLCGQSSFPPT